MILNIIDDKGEITKFSQGKYLNRILRGFADAVEHHNTSVCIIGDGKSGMGKTTLMCQVAKTLDKNFGLYKMHFLEKTFLEGSETKVGLANAQPGDFILFDEAAPISNRSSLSRMNKMITQAMTMVRSKRIYVGFCINSFMDLDKNIAIFRSDLLLHLYGKHLFDRGRYAAFFKPLEGADRIKLLYLYGKKMYDYSRPKANFISTFSKKFVVDEKEYEKQKQQGVNAFLMGGAVEDTKHPRDSLITYVYLNKILNAKQIGEICGLGDRQIYKIAKRDKKNYKGGISNIETYTAEKEVKINE